MNNVHKMMEISKLFFKSLLHGVFRIQHEDCAALIYNDPANVSAMNLS